MKADKQMRIAFVVMLLCLLILLRADNAWEMVVGGFGFFLSSGIFVTAK